mmetsp:Transcript_136803/g.292228  ORF Transcript_136803/g.292228 Transcript_136803/m.292228 type:complete len:161 (+) Transcript_136803:108-590(+)
MGQACSWCADRDDIVVREFLSWLTPLNLDVGPAKLSLTDAGFADDDDNVHISLREFEVRDIELHGTVGCEIPMMGYQELGACVVLDVVKPNFGLLATVDIKDFRTEQAGGGSGLVDGALNAVLSIDMVKQQVCDYLEYTINDQIRQRLGEDSDGESGSED